MTTHEKLDPNTEPGIADTSLADTGSQPITLRDVLTAIFFPPREEEIQGLPTVSMPQLWETPHVVLEHARSVPTNLNAPAVIHYEAVPIEPISSPSPARVAAVGIGMVVAILITYLAQSAARQQGGVGSGLLFGLGGMVWLLLLMFEIAPPDGGLLRRGPVVSGGGAARPLVGLAGSSLATRVILGSLALILSIATYVYSAENTFTLSGVFAWVGSVALWMLVAAERNPEQIISESMQFGKERSWLTIPSLLPLLALALIMAVAMFFRVYNLDAVPNEMTSDHVEKLLDVNDVAHGIHHIFFTRNAGREAFQFYFVPIIARLFGTGMSFMSLKIATVIEALAMIPLMIWLGREVVDQETGFLAGGLLAISWWHTLLARLALRIVLTPLVFTLVLITLIRGIRTGSRKSWVWTGFWLGVGVYSYQAMRIVPLVALAAFLLAVAGPALRALRAKRGDDSDGLHQQIVAGNVISRQALNLLAAGVVSLALFVPLLRVWHDYPDELWNRVINRTTENEVPIQGSPAQVLADNYVKALGMFNFKGDTSWFSSVPSRPALDLITGGLLVLGLIAWLVRIWLRRDPVDVFVLTAGLIMLLPSALAIAFPIENPSTTRASGAIPVVFLLAAWPLALLRQRWSAVLGRVSGSVLAGLLIAVLVSGAALFNYQTYFSDYASSYRLSALNPSEVADAVREQLGPDASLDGVWLQGWPFWHDYRAIGIEAGDITFDNAIIDASTLESYLGSFPQQFSVRPLVFIVHPNDTQALEILSDRFPSGEAVSFTSATQGRDFVLFVVKD